MEKIIILIVTLGLMWNVYPNSKKKETEVSRTLKQLKEENRDLKKSISDYKKVTKLKSQNELYKLELECREGDMKACNEVGIAWFKKKPKKAVEFWELACDKLVFESCYYLGSHWDKKKKRKSAINFYGKACNGDYYIACNNLAVIYFKMKKPKTGLKYFKMACDNDYKAACLNIGQYHEKKKNNVDAIYWYERACSQKIEAGCKVKKKLIKRFTDMCAKDLVVPCIVTGNMYFKLNDDGNAERYFEKACKLNHAVGCFNYGLTNYGLGELFNTEYGWNKACDLKDQYACYLLVALKKQTKLFEKISKYYEGTCSKGNGEGCFNLAVGYSLMGDKMTAMKYLVEAKKRDYVSWAKRDRMRLLKNIAGSSEYKRLKSSIVK